MVNIGEAKDRFSELLRLVENGEEVVVSRDGKPIAEIVRKRRPERISGRLKGQFTISENFDDPLPADLLALFHEGPVVPPDDNEAA